MAKEFILFLKQYGVVGLAVAVIIGGKLNAFIDSLVKDLLMPLIFQPALNAAHVEDISKLSVNGIFYGRVIASAIDFFIVAVVVFIFAKKVLREEKVAKR